LKRKLKESHKQVRGIHFEAGSIDALFEPLQCQRGRMDGNAERALTKFVQTSLMWPIDAGAFVCDLDKSNEMGQIAKKA
jgi:hypothetical protein